MSSRYIIGKEYIIHGKYSAIAVKIKTLNLHKYESLVITGFKIDMDTDIAWLPDKDGLYFFSNDATIEENLIKNREKILNKLIMGNNLEEEIENRIRSAIRDITIDCPDCEYMEDEQYTCTTCWHEGGNGTINITEYLTIKK